MRHPLRAALLAACLIPAFPPALRAEQELPSCRALSALWVNRYYGKLRPDWAKRELRCDLLDAGNPNGLSRKEQIDLTVARAAYILDATEWTRRSPMFRKPLVSYGGISGPPDSMLDWVAARTTGLIYSREVSGAFRHGGNGHIYLGGDNFTTEAVNSGLDGIALAPQLVHEARHADEPHVLCTRQKTGDDPACDTTITEEFYGGGAHGVAALWCAWIANYSRWPSAYRMKVQGVALWVMGPEGGRINDQAAADLWSCRYFNTRLWDRKKKCP